MVSRSQEGVRSDDGAQSQEFAPADRLGFAGQANVQYLRYGRFYVIIATHGVHPFFAAEARRLRDIRKTPIEFKGHSLGCRRERGGGAFHASVRVHHQCYCELRERFTSFAVNRTVEELVGEFRALPFEPYAPVRNQLCGLLRAVNRHRAVDGRQDQVVRMTILRSLRRPISGTNPLCGIVA